MSGDDRRRAAGSAAGRARSGGIPVVLIGLAFVATGGGYLWRLESPLLIDWVMVAIFELLSLSLIYGGYRLGARPSSFVDEVRVLAATVGFGVVGTIVAAALIGLQTQRGVAIVNAWFGVATATVTTATLGAGLSLYYNDLKAERRRLADQAATVSELNKRLTVLHRVLRHNLRNELTVIRGHAEMLLLRDLEPALTESLETLLEHVGHVESLSENAYRLRQVWAEDARVELEVTDLVEECVRELEADHPEVEITTDIPAHAVARAHPRLRLAVSEALENAIVHNDSPTVDVVVDVSRVAPGSGEVAVSIADTGDGIPEFEPDVLEQVEETPLRHATGLGLWLIYWVVEQSGGQLRFEDNEPRGTIVHLTLPAADG